jgi:hypothetical protein
LGKYDDFPTVSFDRPIEDLQTAISRKELFDSLPADLSRDDKCQRSPQKVAGKNQKKSPPKAEEKAATDTQDSAWKQKQVA